MKRALRKVGTEFKGHFGEDCLITGLEIIQPEDERYRRVYFFNAPKKPVLAFQVLNKKTNTVFYKKVPSAT